MVIFFKQKSEALQAFKLFHTFVQTQFQVKFVQTFFGREFKPFTKFFTELGINQRLTCPHTSHQNGSVERKHRHIVEIGLTLLAHVSLPLTY